MQTIHVKYVNPTNTRGAALKATASSTAGTVSVSPHSYDSTEAAYKDAAEKLKKKLGWTGDMYGGHVKNGMVFVFKDEQLKINPKARAKKTTKLVTKSNPNTRKYSGKYPNNVGMFYSTGERGVLAVVTNAGKKYEFTAPELNYNEPKLKTDIKVYLDQQKAYHEKGAVKKNPIKRKTLTTKKPCKTCKNFRVSASNDNKVWHKIADFYIQKNATEYARAYGKMFTNKFIKVESL